MEVELLERGMYIRCPIAEFDDPRNFIIGRIIQVNDFTENVTVAFLDPFGFRNYYENIPEKAELPYDYVNLKSSQVFIRATEFNSDVRKVQKAKLLIPDEQILLNDPIPQRREIREIYEKIYTRIPKVAEAEKEKANRLLEQIGMYLDYEDIDDEDIEDLIDKIKDFYATASNSLVNIHGNIQVLDGIKKDAKTISVAFGEVEKGIASTDDIDTLLMFSKDPLTKLERVLSILQTVQKDIEYVARDVEKRRGNILVDNGGDLSTRYVELRNKIELDSKTIMDWKVM